MIEKLNKKFIQEPSLILEHTKDSLKVIDKLEDTLNALVSVTATEAIDFAKESEARFESGTQKGVLDGTTVTIKDMLCTKDFRTTASSKMLENYYPPYDATVVEKLKNAGVVIVGKNNCDAWAHGASTENSDFGVTVNPWDDTRVSGGSSGGSAAAVAAGECDFSIGTDTGGSIRQPAGFCGVVGLKPTYGRVSRFGVVSMASSLDCVGPIANSTEDIANVLQVIAGKDPKDATTLDVPVPDYLATLKTPLKGKKVGLAKEFFEGLNPEINKAMESAKQDLVSLGVELVDISLPLLKYAVPTYYIIQTAEVSSNLGRYDGVKYGHSSESGLSLIDNYFKSRDEGFGREAKRRIMLGTFVLSAGFYDAYYSRAMKVRTLIKKDFDEALKKVDVILSPVSPTTAFKIGEKAESPVEMYLADIYTAAINLAGNPALSLPCGFDANKLPIGMQIIGKQFDEQLVLNFGHQFEIATKDLDWRSFKPVLRGE